MAANKPKWPECRCAKRCAKRKCNAVGSRRLQASAKPGSPIKSAYLGLIRRKYAPQKLKLVLKIAEEVSIKGVICHMAGISENALRYALMGSEQGSPGDIFDFKLEDGTTERFHILFQDALESADGKLEITAFQMATGTYQKVLEYQGRVTYKKDHRLVAKGLPEEECYLRDKNGDLIPETKPFVDPEMVRWMLAKRMPDVYGKRPKPRTEPERPGGVLVVDNPMSRAEYERRFGGPQKIVPPLKKK